MYDGVFSILGIDLYTIVVHLPTVDWDRPILTKLLFCFMNLANEVDETLSWFWHSLFRPVCELKLPYCPRLSILGTHKGGTVQMWCFIWTSLSTMDEKNCWNYGGPSDSQHSAVHNHPCLCGISTERQHSLEKNVPAVSFKNYLSWIY